MATVLRRKNLFDPLVTVLILRGSTVPKVLVIVELQLLSRPRLSGLFDYPDLFPRSGFFMNVNKM